VPIKPCQVRGKKGHRWGNHGKCYTGKGSRARAAKQAAAIKASGWTGNAFCPTGKGGGVDASCGKVHDFLRSYPHGASVSMVSLRTGLTQKKVKEALASLEQAGHTRSVGGVHYPTTPAASAMPPALAVPTPATIIPSSAKGEVSGVLPHPDTVAAAVRSLDRSGNNAVPLTRFRKHLADVHGLKGRAAQDAAIIGARKAGKVSLGALEGRHGITAEERQAAIEEESSYGTTYLGTVSVRNAAPTAKTALDAFSEWVTKTV
jgi:hypothetical protein